jgi:cellulose synthase/poly-beta-1,6-N-acetylglucosamine synthase-like glycosyltransferase
MGKVRYLIYGSIVVGIFAVLHLVIPPTWSTWISKSNQMFAGVRIQFIGLYILGSFLFFAIPLLYGISFLASFGKIKYPEGSETYTPPISIIMPAINEEKIIGNTLNSFSQKNNYPKEKFEIIVVASGSTDRTAEICREYQDRLNIQVLLDPLPKKGKPAALNYGLKHVSQDIICIYDADTQLYENTLRYLVRHLHNPEIAAATGPVIVRNWKDNKLTKGIALEYTYLSGTGLYFEGRSRLGRSLWLLGRNYAIRKSVIEEFGGWNEDALTEDLHLSAQLSAAKKKVQFAPEAKITENVPNNFDAFMHQRRRWVGGYSQSLSAAMELDLRTVILRNLAMMHFGHTIDFALGALVAAIIFGFIGDLYIVLICVATFIFTFGTHAIAVRKYGEGKYRLLIYSPIAAFINFVMFRLQFANYEELEWEKTELN